jgi:nucleoside-diphosphate-sugar epimerase
MVLITGSSSLLGRSLMMKLLNNGEKVRCLDLDKPKDLPPGVEFVQSSIVDDPAIGKACNNIGSVFHLLDVKSTRHGGRRFMRSVNVKGTRILLEAAQAAGVEKFFFQSSYEVYGGIKKFPSDESAPLKPATRYGKDKLRAEKFCRQRIKDGGIDLTIFRPSPIVGPGTRNPITLITLLMALGMEEANRVYVAGHGENRFQLLHPDDAASAFVLAYASPLSKGKTYNLGSDDVPMQIDQVLAVIDRAKLDCTMKHLTTSYTKFLSYLLRPFKIDYLNRGHLMYLLANLVLDCQAAKSDLAWQPSRGNVDIILETIKWYREELL